MKLNDSSNGPERNLTCRPAEEGGVRVLNAFTIFHCYTFVAFKASRFRRFFARRTPGTRIFQFFLLYRLLTISYGH